jgi:hypothetical protein
MLCVGQSGWCCKRSDKMRIVAMLMGIALVVAATVVLMYQFAMVVARPDPLGLLVPTALIQVLLIAGGAMLAVGLAQIRASDHSNRKTSSTRRV